MAKLKIHNKTVDGIKDVEIRNIVDGYLHLCLCMQEGTKQEIKIKLIPETKLLLEVSGSIKVLKCENCVWIYGDVQQVNTTNCCYVEGSIKDSPRAAEIQVDREIKVCHGNEQRKRDVLERHFPYNEVQFDTIQIEGSLTSLKDKEGLETVVHGSVIEAEIGNCAWIKGTVESAYAGNRIFCTMDESQAKSTKDLQKEADRHKTEVEDLLSSMFEEVRQDEELRTRNFFA